MSDLRRMVMAALVCGLIIGCPAPTGPLDDGDADTGTTTTSDGGGGSTVGDTAPLGYGGSLSGTVSTSISSSDATGSDVTATRWAPMVIGQSAQIVRGLSEGATVSFWTLDGDPLTDADGNPYPAVAVNSDGTFEASGLPIGVDFVIKVDLDGDGEADLTHVVSIPKDEDGEGGSVTGVDVNPLTTVAVAKLMTVIEEKGVSADSLDFSPAAVIDQLIQAFSSLFELMGIDSTITADQIMSMTIDALARAFDELVPDSVKTTMDMATGKIDIAGAESAEDLVLAVIPVLLRAGIAVADERGGVELDSIAELPDVEIVTWEELWGPPDGFEDPPPPPMPAEENRIFRSTVVEVDRNFAMAQDEAGKRGPGLVIHKHALEQMAGLAFERRTLSLGDLHTLATDLNIGMGMRLTYGVPMPPSEPGQEPDPTPPPMMFQSADQRGVAVDVRALEEQIHQIWERGSFSDQQRAGQEAAVRDAVKAALGATQAPSIEQLFGGIIRSENVTMEKLSSWIRNARAHIPFNWSGPAQLYVLADRDRWRDSAARPVTVDILLDQGGRLTRVTYNPNGDSRYYLNVWGDPEFGYMAEVIVAGTGRTIFDKTGQPVWGDPSNESVFRPAQHPITGQTVSFLEAFSETGEHWPIEPALSVSNPWFDPERDPDPDSNPPTIAIPVLVTQPGPEGVVVTVSVAQDGTVARDEAGNHALEMFWEGPPVEDWMAVLIDTRTGQRLREDPTDENSPEVRVTLDQITGLDVVPQVFTRFFDIEIPNPMYNPEGDPWYDDINDNDRWDLDEPTFDWKEELWMAGDWRSTNVERYYRRADNNRAVRERDVNWDASTPKTWTAVELVPRNFKRRKNAFTFGRPNSAINLLTAFLRPDVFDGTHRLDANTRVSTFGALAVMNLVFDARLYNLEAYIVDYRHDGPRPAELQIVEAWPWHPPIDDPVRLFIAGFEEMASAP